MPKLASVPRRSPPTDSINSARAPLCTQRALSQTEKRDAHKEFTSGPLRSLCSSLFRTVVLWTYCLVVFKIFSQSRVGASGCVCVWGGGHISVVEPSSNSGTKGAFFKVLTHPPLVRAAISESPATLEKEAEPSMCIKLK